jgi:hypothetical protein
MESSTKWMLGIVGVIIVFGGGYVAYNAHQKKKAKKEGLDVKTYKQVKKVATKLGKEVSQTVKAKTFFDKDELMAMAKDKVKQSNNT